ncbi:MAG: enoyl-CoA hydratase-related protein [Candidatus Kapabacteria bacterium]|nr:enoyl-CoA hydratase-related protein [Candidatus Kapabacteria bacterium]
MQKIEFTLTHSGAIAQIILNDGKGNVLDSIMMAELHQVFTELKANKAVKLITFEGAGKHFSFGASVAEHTKELAPAMLKGFIQLFRDVVDMQIPVLSKISGQCLGGGLELALISNFMFADKSAKMGQPEIILGVFAPPASILLPLKIGYAKAEELLLTGRTITADEANSIGLLNGVFEDKITMNAAIEEWIVANILPKSASSLRFAVRAARSVFNNLLIGKAEELEKMYVEELMESHDANEGIAAFLEKRAANWEND